MLLPFVDYLFGMVQVDRFGTLMNNVELVEGTARVACMLTLLQLTGRVSRLLRFHDTIINNEQEIRADQAQRWKGPKLSAEFFSVEDAVFVFSVQTLSGEAGSVSMVTNKVAVSMYTTYRRSSTNGQLRLVSVRRQGCSARTSLIYRVLQPISRSRTTKRRVVSHSESAEMYVPLVMQQAKCYSFLKHDEAIPGPATYERPEGQSLTRSFSMSKSIVQHEL